MITKQNINTILFNIILFDKISKISEFREENIWKLF